MVLGYVLQSIPHHGAQSIGETEIGDFIILGNGTRIRQGPEFDVAGLAFPGVPGVPHFGHAGAVAWAVTNAMADYQDLYAEDLRRVGGRAEVRNPDGFAAARAHTETVLVKDGEPVPVEVIDSGSLGMGLGFAALPAADAADRGLAADEVAAEARRRATDSSAYFYVDTLEYLRRGGRIGAGQALLGTALAVKPLLYLEHGAIRLLEKVRTSSRAVGRLEDLAVACAGDGPVDVAVHHQANAGRADDLAGRLRARIPLLGDLVVAEVGAVIGAHVGPGLLAVIVSPR